MAYSHILSTSIKQVSIATHIVMRCQLLIPHRLCIIVPCPTSVSAVKTMSVGHGEYSTIA